MIRRRDRGENIVPRDYWGPLWSNPLTLLNDMDRMFDEFKNDWESTFAAPLAARGDLTRQPLLDLTDSGEEFVVKAEVPGIPKDRLNIEVTDEAIEISGESTTEKETEEEGFVRRERRYSRFHRVLPLPEKIVPDRTDAELKDGLLTVRLPKAAPPEKKTKKIPVK